MRYLNKSLTALALLLFVPAAFVGCGGTDTSAPPSQAEMEAEDAEIEAEEAAEEAEAAKQDSEDE